MVIDKDAIMFKVFVAVRREDYEKDTWPQIRHEMLNNVIATASEEMDAEIAKKGWTR